jgi:predicted glycosyltransferase
MFTLLWQLPRLLRVIRREHEWLNEIIFKEGIDGIISDNRYGMWHVQIPSVILTHQPGVLTGLGSAADKIIRDIHYRYLRRFGEVWIPDLPGRPNLGGRLSHPDSLPERSRYIGWLSQFRPHQKAGNREEHILILLSGPEPQRTMLADKLWQQAKTLQQPIVFIEGKAGIERKDALPHIRHIPFADTQMLQPLLENASLVICRSGYSTLMDLAGFSKPAVLIPTPGQTEQEYLAHNLASAGFFYRADQKDISLANAVKLAESGSKPGMSATLHDESLLASALDEWLAGL